MLSGSLINSNHPQYKMLIFNFIREKSRVLLNIVKAFFLPEPFKSVLPYTMLSIKRLKSLKSLVLKLSELSISGDIVECGVCNGGSAVILSEACTSSKFKRNIFLLDSFDGLPEIGEFDEKKSAGYVGSCKGNKETIYKVLKKLNLSDENIKIVEGDFEKTIPLLPCNKIALLHIDADWYNSVKLCLDNLYDKVEKGGFIVIDDYGYWKGCKKAVHDFEKERRLTINLTKVDSTAVYFQKQ